MVTPLTQAQVFQESNQFIPKDVLSPLAAHLAGGYGRLFRYTNPTEKLLISLGNYLVNQNQTYSWPQLPPGAIVDLSYVSLYMDNAYLLYFQAALNQDTITTLPNQPNQIQAASTNWASNGNYPRASSLYNRDVQPGDGVFLQNATGSSFWTTVAGVQAVAGSGSIGTVTADPNNAPTQTAQVQTAFTAGPSNYVGLTNTKTVNYDGSASDGLYDVYTITVIQGSVGGDATTARLQVTTSSGQDNVSSLQPKPFGLYTRVGRRGLRVQWTNTNTNNSLASGVSATDFVVGQTWQVTIQQAWTAPTANAGGTYNGTNNQQYVITVSQGGPYQAMLPLAAPTTAPTVNPTGGGSSGGQLPPATYKVTYTWVNNNGETTASPEATFTVNAGNVPQVQLPPLPTNITGANIYLTAPNGPSGTEELYLTNVSGTVNLTTPLANWLPTAGTATTYADPQQAPTVNVTGGGTTGGNLPAGNYQVAYTYVTANGESLFSPPSATFTVAAGNVPQVTLPALPTGITSYNLYITAPGAVGAGFAFLPYQKNITTTTVNLSATIPGTPPITNTAGVSAPSFTPIVSPTGATTTAGTWPPGTYYLKLTWVTSSGETTPGPESAAFTLAVGNGAEITNMPTSFPTGVTSMNVYVTQPGAPAGSEIFFFNTTSLTGNLNLPWNLQVKPPTANTTSPTLANPTTAPTVNVSGGGTSGGPWGAGNYSLSYTIINHGGETLPSPSASFTLTAGEVPQISGLANPIGALGYRFYLTPNGQTQEYLVLETPIQSTVNLASYFPLSWGTPTVAGRAVFSVPTPTTAPTVNPTGGGTNGGFLPSGTYSVTYTIPGGVLGETLAAPPVSFTINQGNIPTVTLPAFVPGVYSYNLFLTQPGGPPSSATRIGALQNSKTLTATINVSLADVLLQVPPAVTTATALGPNPNPPQITVTTTIGSDFSGPTPVPAAGANVPVGSYGVQISFTGQGLNVGDRYYLQVIGPAQGPMRILQLTNNVPTALQNTPLAVSLFLKKTQNWQLPPIGATGNTNWSAAQSGITVNANATAFDPSWTNAQGQLLPLPVKAGPDTLLYAHYRAWMPTYTQGLFSISDPTTLNQVFSFTPETTVPVFSSTNGPQYSGNSVPVPHPDTVLPYAVYQALRNSNGQTVWFTAVPDPNQVSLWETMLGGLVGAENIYGMVPLTTNSQVLAAYQQYVDGQSAAELWRTAWFNAQAPAAYPIVIAPVAPATTPTATTSDGQPALATITANPQGPANSYTYLICTSGNGQFQTNGVQPGDIVRINFAQNAYGQSTWSSFLVAQVLNQDTLLLSAGPSVSWTVPQRMEIWRQPTSQQTVTYLAAQAKQYNDARVRLVWPDQLTDDQMGWTVPGYFLCAALAAYASAIAPMQDLRYLALSGFVAPVTRTTLFFTPAQALQLGQAGAFVVTSGPSGPIYCQSSLTTAQEGGLLAQLEVSVRNQDALNYLLAAVLSNYIGKANVTTNALTMMRHDVQSALTRAEGIQVNRLGPLVVSASIQNLVPNTSSPDSVLLSIQATLTYPTDTVVLTLQSGS